MPGSLAVKAGQKSLQPPAKSTDVVSIIKGVIEAELGAIRRDNGLVQACDGVDYVTQDLAMTILTDEQEHLREFEGFLRGVRGEIDCRSSIADCRFQIEICNLQSEQFS